MRSVTSMALAATAALFLAGGVHAATFDFSYSFPTEDRTDFPSGQTSASGVFTATDQMDGSFLVVDVSGEWNGETITGVAPVGSEGGNDNLIFPTESPVLDGFGVAFTVSGPIAGDGGEGFVNVYFTPTGYTDFGSPTLYSPTFNLTASSGMSEPSGAPEPSTWALMMLGVGVVGSALRRKVSSAVAA